MINCYPYHTKFAEDFFEHIGGGRIEFENVNNKYFISKQTFDLSDLPMPQPNERNTGYWRIESGDNLRKYEVYFVLHLKKFVIYIDGEFDCDYAVAWGCFFEEQQKQLIEHINDMSIMIEI